MTPIDDKTVKRNIQDLVTSATGEKANFVVLAGQDIGRKFEINKSTITIGRSETSDIFIDDEDVSRSHARVIVTLDNITIEDLGSTNGTLVNGQKIKRHALEDGDRIQIGNITVLKFNFLDTIEDTFNEQLYNAANKDFLTQIYNKKYFVDRLRSEFAYSKRHEAPLSLIIFDLDHFKKINDTYGHSAGDFILKELSAQISTMKRQEDLFARFGGEEFVILLRDTTKETAIQIAEKLRGRVEEIDFNFDGTQIPVTVSVGVTTFEQTNYKNSDTFFRAADSQLLRAKQNGRNRISFAKEGLAEPKPDLGSLN